MTTASESSTTTRRLYLGIDVGGTGIKLGVVDDSGTALGHTQIDTEHERGAADGVSRILDAAKGIVDELNFSSCSLRIANSTRSNFDKSDSVVD